MVKPLLSKHVTKFPNTRHYQSWRVVFYVPRYWLQRYDKKYTINGKLGDRKGVESENGIKSAFRKAKQQGCKVVVLDFDMHMSESILKTKKIVSGLFGRHEDFSEGSLEECYVVHNSKAVVVNADAFSAPDKETIKQLIKDVIERLRT